LAADMAKSQRMISATQQQLCFALFSDSVLHALLQGEV